MRVSYFINKNNEVWGEHMMTNVHVVLPSNSKVTWNYRATIIQQSDKVSVLISTDI